MAKRPVIIFPVPRVVTRKPLHGGGGKPHLPPPARQSQRLSPQFNALQKQFEDKVRMQVSSTGIIPEEVIVLETVGSIEKFFMAVKRIEGMEWLAEWDETEIPPDDDFFKDDEHKDEALTGRLFLIMTNQQAMQQLLSLWQQYTKYPSQAFEHGLGKFKDLFSQLRQVRTWGVQDRLIENRTIEYWRNTIAYAENEDVVTEIELWFRQNPENRFSASQEIRKLIDEISGHVLQESTIPEIAYQSILTRLPAKYVERVIEDPNTKLVQSEHIMFFRPSGQTNIRVGSGEPLRLEKKITRDSPTSGKPIVALLDGIPLDNHDLLRGRLIIDDPDQWSTTVQTSERNHGTAMASLICHGELDNTEKSLSSPLYVRPILLPDQSDFSNYPPQELIPDTVLHVDLIFRAFKRIFEGDGIEPASAPSVKVINLSIGDSARPFEGVISPLARLLDWLSWRYRVLIIVSAGNCSNDISIGMDRDEFKILDEGKVQECVIKALAAELKNRRILSPAESLNGVTVAASHEDSSTYSLDGRLNVYKDGMPSPMNTFGLGFRRAVKPELLVPGGRQLFRERITTELQTTTMTIDASARAPGQLVAAPARQSGVANAVRYVRGTSNATALTTRAAAMLYERILEWRELPGGETLGEHHTAVLLKAMLIHGAYWGESISPIEFALKTMENRNKFREQAARFLGYGMMNQEMSILCNDERAVLIGTGELASDDAHLFTLPQPASLSGKKLWRRLTITLAWLTPINCEHRTYRRAALWFEPPAKAFHIERKEVDWKAVMRGTVQHEVLDGYKAIAFKKGDSVEIQVNCRADAGNLEEKVPYALLVTLEVEPGSGIPIWQEIVAAIRPAVRIQPES